MSDALALLGARLAETPLAAAGFTLTAHGDALGFAHAGVDTGLRVVVRMVRVPRLDALRAEGRWIEVTVPPSPLAAAEHPVVLLVVDDAGHTVWARDEFAQPSDEPRQVRVSALAGAAGFGLYRLFLLLAAASLRPVIELQDQVRLRAQLRRFLEDGEAFATERDELRALAIPGWFVAACAIPIDDETVGFATPPFIEALAVELRGARETLTARGVTLHCVRGGTHRAVWEREPGGSPLGFTLRVDHARATVELRASLRGLRTSAAGLAGAARFVWRFGQGGHVTLLPGCAASGVGVGSVVPALEHVAVTHATVETMEALAAIERATGAAFVLDPARLDQPDQAEAIRELLLVWSSGRAERTATAMRLALSGGEVRALLAASEHQRRITFRLPPSRVSHAVLGVDVALGVRTQEVTGTLVQSPATLIAQIATLGPTERLDVELSAVELRETYARAPTAATTTEPPATRGAPSGSRSGST